jgi:4-amino-4-deoxy-L-arabinose transferase-like glycosyltransferase
MNNSIVSPPSARFPLPAAWLAALCLLYLLVGGVGHDPWKADDATHLGVAWGFFNGGNWLVPRIGGEAWTGTVPGYHWVAAATAWFTQWALPFHDGARLATALFGAGFLYFIWRAAARLHGREAGFAAPALAIGTLGLLVPIHDAQPAIAVLAAASIAWYGLACLPSLSGAFWLGLGCGLAFLFGGLTGAAPVLPLLFVPLLRRRWIAFGIALYVAISVASLWPTLLALRDPQFLLAWWRNELAALAKLRGARVEHLQLLSWFAWPILPLGAWAAWIGRRQWRAPELALPFAGTLIALAWFALREARPLNALPLLPPLVLLATAGADKLRRGAANAFDWFGMMTFTLTVGLIWLGGIAMLSGWPAQIARNFAKLEPGFVARFSFVALAFALLCTAAWAAALARLPRSPWRAALRWSAGVVAMWGVLVALWFPWIDYGKTYRGVAQSLRRALPADAGCVEGRGLGLAQRAVLDYWAGIRTTRGAGNACRWLLVQGRGAAPAGWEKTWEGHRPGDKTERFRLFHRED